MGLFRKECSLCGGKLDNNICVECGLDNSKCDKQYISMGKVHQDSESLTHVHKEYNPLVGKTVTKDWAQNVSEKKRRIQAGVNHSNTYQSSSLQKTKKKSSKIGVVIAVIVLFINLLPLLFDLVGNLMYGAYEPYPEPGIEEVYPDDPYAYVTYELSEVGLNYEAELTAGTYKGGVHIPEGSYQVIFIPEEGVEDCYIDLSMNDMRNAIYQSFYFGDLEKLYEINDFRVYDGGIIEIEGRGALHFYSVNAQSEHMTSMENPNTQNYYLSDSFEVGKDIVAGVYDVYQESGSGIFDYDVMTKNGYMMYCGKLIGDQESGFAGVLKNVVLPEGTMVYMDGLAVQLVPSEKIESKDYLGFYDNY